MYLHDMVFSYYQTLYLEISVQYENDSLLNKVIARITSKTKGMNMT